MNCKFLKHNQRAPATQVIDSANKAALKTPFVAIQSISGGNALFIYLHISVHSVVSALFPRIVGVRPKNSAGVSLWRLILAHFFIVFLCFQDSCGPGNLHDRLNSSSCMSGSPI